MRIGILADIHDNIWNLRAALVGLGEAEALICCGDLCSPFVIGLLAEGFPARPIHIVFGNNDGDLFRIAQNASKQGTITLHGEVFKGELGGKRVFVNHYPEIARAVVAEDYDLVCYGHDHRFVIAQRGVGLLVNPGAIMGYDAGTKRDVPATFVSHDTATGTSMAYEIITECGAAAWRVVPFLPA